MDRLYYYLNGTHALDSGLSVTDPFMSVEYALGIVKDTADTATEMLIADVFFYTDATMRYKVNIASVDTRHILPLPVVGLSDVGITIAELNRRRVDEYLRGAMDVR